MLVVQKAVVNLRPPAEQAMTKYKTHHSNFFPQKDDQRGYIPKSLKGARRSLSRDAVNQSQDDVKTLHHDSITQDKPKVISAVQRHGSTIVMRVKEVKPQPAAAAQAANSFRDLNILGSEVATKHGQFVQRVKPRIKQQPCRTILRRSVDYEEWVKAAQIKQNALESRFKPLKSRGGRRQVSSKLEVKNTVDPRTHLFEINTKKLKERHV